MEKPSFKLVGAPCGQHGQYTFYKALRVSGETERIIAIGDFFFVRIWQDSELVSIGELQLLWTDRVSDQTLVSLRLYFLPENTPDGRNLHGEDEVLALNEKVVVRAEDLLSWVCAGSGWRCGLRAVWRGACAPSNSDLHTAPLHHTRLDFTDVDTEKGAIALDADSPGVVVFSYPRYCRYRALVSRLEGIEAAWLRDSLVAALGGYAANTNNTRILYCKDTFEYPELEGHEFVCNHLAPRLKGRPRGRRRRLPRSRSRSRSSRSSDSDAPPPLPREPKNPRRLSLRNGAPDRRSEEEDESTQTSEDRGFLHQLRQFYRDRNEPFKMAHSLKDLSLRALYEGVASRGGYEAVCRHKLWRVLHADRPARVRSHYERFLLPFENHERRNGSKYFQKPNGKIDSDPKLIDTIDVTDSPLREIPKQVKIEDKEKPENLETKRLRTPSPKIEEKHEIKEEINTTSKPAEELNREFLDSLPNVEKPLKITVKPVEKLIEKNDSNVIKLFEENSALITELSVKYNVKDVNVIEELGRKQLSETSSVFLGELAQRLNLASPEVLVPSSLPLPLTSLSSLSDKYVSNGHNEQTQTGTHVHAHAHARPAGAGTGTGAGTLARSSSSLRAVRVKPTRSHGRAHGHTPPIPPLRPDSASSSPPTSGAPPLTPVTNFGIHHPPSTASHSDDEIVEVPYKPKTPEIIDLDEYPESPQSVKKKKLDILKERGLEVTAIAPAWGTPPLTPLINPPMILNPAMQHQIMTQASLFQMYNIIPQNYANGIQPPKVIQATCIYGSSGPEKTVYGNPKDPFMPPPHILHGTPVKPQRVVTTTQEQPRQDVLDLTCKTSTAPSQKPAVEIVRIPSSSPSKSAQNLTKNYTLIDGKAVVGSNLEITLVNPKMQTPPKNRPVQKRSSNGKFMSTKTPTPPKDYPRPYPSPSSVNLTPKKSAINVPNYQIRDDVSPTSSTGSRDSQTNIYKGQNYTQIEHKTPNLAQIMDMQKGPSLAQIMDMQKSQNLAQIMDMQKSQNFAQIMDMQKSQNFAQIMDMQKNQNLAQMMDKPSLPPFMDPAYLSALYSFSQMDQRHVAMYNNFMAHRSYSSPLGGVATPTTKN